MIPPITDPLGKYWDQPKGEILVDDTHALMDRKSFGELGEYSTSTPSGVYEGKMWKTFSKRVWYLRWYENSGPNHCRIQTRRIILVSLTKGSHRDSCTRR
jgi:hypothetical protein